MLVLAKTQQNRTAHISMALSISSGKSPREKRISSGTANVRWDFNKGMCVLVWLRQAMAGGPGGGADEDLAAASAPAGQVHLD